MISNTYFGVIHGRNTVLSNRLRKTRFGEIKPATSALKKQQMGVIPGGSIETPSIPMSIKPHQSVPIIQNNPAPPAYEHAPEYEPEPQTVPVHQPVPLPVPAPQPVDEFGFNQQDHMNPPDPDAQYLYRPPDQLMLEAPNQLMLEAPPDNGQASILAQPSLKVMDQVLLNHYNQAYLDEYPLEASKSKKPRVSTVSKRPKKTHVLKPSMPRTSNNSFTFPKTKIRSDRGVEIEDVTEDLQSIRGGNNRNQIAIPKGAKKLIIVANDLEALQMKEREDKRRKREEMRKEKMADPRFKVHIRKQKK